MSTTKQPHIQTYLYFGGRCEEAIEFYRKAIGAEVEMLMRFNECPEPLQPGMIPPAFEKKIMHSSLRIGDSVVMASDGCSEGATFTGFGLSLSLPTVAEVDRVFAALSAGGQVRMPLEKTFWSQRFGMVADKFGVAWMVTIQP